MAQDVLGKTVRIDDKRYDPKGAKLEVWTKGRHKYLIRYVDPEGKNAPESSKILYINTTGKAEKPNASLSDDEVIKEYLLEIKQTVLFNIEVGLPPHPMCHQILNVIQDPYSNETINKRIYGDGSPYYLNNGCSISIEWLGRKPNPDFVLGTFSNPDDAERYYRRDLIPGESVSGFKKKRGPSRYLQWNRDTTKLADGIDRNAAWYLLNGTHKGFNKDGVVILPESPEEDGVIITSGVDNADDSSTLPTSSWVINEGPVNPINDFDNNGIDDSFEGPFSEGLFRDKSYIFGKKVTIELPEGVNEENLVWTNKTDNLQYISNSLPEGSEYKKTILIPTGFTGSNGEPGMRPVEVTETKPIIQYFDNSYENAFKDSNIILEVIERFKSMVISKNGIRDYDLKLCSPDSESCKFIDYISPLEDIKPEVPVEAPVAAADAPPVDNGKIKLNIQGLFDIDGTTPGSSQSVFEIKAKTDMPSFLVWTGKIPKTDETDEFDDSEVDDEYLESGFEGIDETPAWMTESSPLGGSLDSPSGTDLDNEEPLKENGSSNTSQTLTENSPRGNSPVKGSKLVNGNSMINLGGFRLKSIPADLQKYLRANGFPTIVIGSNGIMRDLKGSAYPSSSKRVAASYHGCGLAHDLTFSGDFVGTKWKGITDNPVLAANADFNKACWNWTQTQGDLTWGGEWGKSTPWNGVVKGWGTTEMHHWQIKEPLQAAYWDPVKDELTKFGFTAKQMVPNGKGTNLHKLMLKLMDG